MVGCRVWKLLISRHPKSFSVDERTFFCDVFGMLVLCFFSFLDVIPHRAIYVMYRQFILLPRQ